jgi:hypothetical protein
MGQILETGMAASRERLKALDTAPATDATFCRVANQTKAPKRPYFTFIPTAKVAVPVHT